MHMAIVLAGLTCKLGCVAQFVDCMATHQVIVAILIRLVGPRLGPRSSPNGEFAPKN